MVIIKSCHKQCQHEHSYSPPPLPSFTIVCIGPLASQSVNPRTAADYVAGNPKRETSCLFLLLNYDLRLHTRGEPKERWWCIARYLYITLFSSS